MRLSLKAGEKIYMNGAVFSVDRKVSIELLNDATFLLEAHVMQIEAATSPLKQIYFAIQLMLMDPGETASIRGTVEAMFAAFAAAAGDSSLADRVAAVQALFRKGRPIEALKALRSLFATEAALLQPMGTNKTSTAAHEVTECR